MVYIPSVMKAQIFYLTKKEKRDNPRVWFDIDEVIKNIKNCKINSYAKVYEMELDESKILPSDKRLNWVDGLKEFSETIWTLMNGMAGGEDPDGIPNPLGNPQGQQKIRNLGVGHTSMSVGDFIVFKEIYDNQGFLPEKLLVADDMGFKVVEPKDLGDRTNGISINVLEDIVIKNGELVSDEVLK
jgi:hypothetical protein